VLTGQRSEFAGVVVREHARSASAGRGRTLVNLALQRPNSLLHDGHGWPDNAPHQILSSTRRMLALAERARAGFVVHASYAFLGNAEQGGAPGDGLRPIVEAACEAEQLVLRSGRRACVVRVGYLYGPEMHDLRAYRTAFRLGRPYWAGPRRTLQHHVHSTDAARALLRAAELRPAGSVVYATDATPASFADLMDHFARLVGRSRPLHLPAISGPLVQLVVGRLHQEMTRLPAGAATPRVPGYRPRYRDFRAGLAQVVEAWREQP
jgi:nucleoside-diphosphate-sugar epimerase